jgi:hypothetical protein
VAKAGQVDPASLENVGGVGILAQSKEEMLEQDLRLGLAGGILACPEQRRLQSRGHRDSAAILSHCLRHPLRRSSLRSISPKGAR